MPTASDTLRRALMLLFLIAVLSALGYRLKHLLPAMESWLQNLGALAPLGYIAAFVLLTPLFVSVDALCFAAGILFPLLSGEFYMIVATYLAAALMFVLGRHLLKAKIAALIARRQKFINITDALKKRAFKIMFLLRLTPLPFALLSYLFAAAPVRFWPYLAATSGIFLYNATLVALGHAARYVAGAAGQGTVPATILYPALILGILATLLAGVKISRLAGKILKDLN